MEPLVGLSLYLFVVLVQDSGPRPLREEVREVELRKFRHGLLEIYEEVTFEGLLSGTDLIPLAKTLIEPDASS